MMKVLHEYIEKHKLCSELLFDDWKEFLEVLYSEGGRVESILWFEHVKISHQKASLGSGGYKDEKNPEYMYAETQIFKNHMESLSLSQIIQYINLILNSYPNNRLIPSFFIIT